MNRIKTNMILQNFGLKPLRTSSIQKQSPFSANTTPHPSVFTRCPIWGIDVSKWQGDIDFVKAKSDGIKFVFAKCSEGYLYFDPKFERNYSLAKEQNLIFGAYHFVRPGIGAKNQLETIKKALEGKELDYFALDCEVTDGMSRSAITDVVWSLMMNTKSIIKAKKWAIYSRYSWWNPYIARSTNWKSNADAWTAHWGVEFSNATPWVMPDWDIWTIWQAGIVSKRFGVDGDVDFDVWNPMVEFPGNITPPEPPPPSNDLPESFDVILKPKGYNGVTYSGVAKKEQ